MGGVVNILNISPYADYYDHRNITLPSEDSYIDTKDMLLCKSLVCILYKLAIILHTVNGWGGDFTQSQALFRIH